MTKPIAFTVKLADKQTFNQKFTKYVFEVEQPHRFKFKAGQFVSVDIKNNGERRSYSICSNPSIEHSFELLIDYDPNGKGVKFFKQLKFGDVVNVLGPMGNLVMNTDDQHEAIVFVATGSGVAPFRSMILQLLQNVKEQRPIILYWGLRYIQDLFWEAEFQDLVDAYPNFHFHPVLSKAIEEWSLCRGRVTDCLSIHQLPNTASYYLCGGTQMIQDVQKVLIDRNVPSDDIHYEKFY